MSETLGDQEDRLVLGGVESRIESVENLEMREDEFSDNEAILDDICRKRKRSDEEQEEEEVVVVEEEENDGFKTPTRPENRIPEMKECPPAPKRDIKRYSEMFRGNNNTCRRRLSFPPENSIATFITDLQWKTTTMTIKK